MNSKGDQETVCSMLARHRYRRWNASGCWAAPDVCFFRMDRATCSHKGIHICMIQVLDRTHVAIGAMNVTGNGSSVRVRHWIEHNGFLL